MNKIKGTLLGVFLFATPAAAFSETQIIELTQIPCTIVEAEREATSFKAASYDECKAINRKTAGERAFNLLKLKAGPTIFRVSNANVEYPLGFWVRGKGVGRVTLPSTSGGGLMRGQTKDYYVVLEPGEYLYSCPLNPTPDYPLLVKP